MTCSLRFAGFCHLMMLSVCPLAEGSPSVLSKHKAVAGWVHHYCYCREKKYYPFEDPRDFAYRIEVKENAPELLRRAVSRVPVDVMATGDYQATEKKFGLSRRMLEVCLGLGFPVECYSLPRGTARRLATARLGLSQGGVGHRGYGTGPGTGLPGDGPQGPREHRQRGAQDGRGYRGFCAAIDIKWGAHLEKGE
jgi:hypothetical protein